MDDLSDITCARQCVFMHWASTHSSNMAEFKTR